MRGLGMGVAMARRRQPDGAVGGGAAHSGSLSSTF
jgi:hypothetical protein